MRRRWRTGLVAAVVSLLLTLAVAPAWGQAGCAGGGREVPPPPVDTSEVPAPGAAAPAPLPVPAAPVGGARMAECGVVVAAGAPAPPNVTAASWVLADLDSGQVLAARDPHARQRPASLVKVLLALVAIRKLDPQAVVVGTEADAQAQGSRVGMGVGGQYTVRQLLAGLLLNSGNDAANALAGQLGGVPAAIADMTDTARRLGALDTRPASPSGLDGPGMSASAYDMALLFREAMRLPLFAETTATRLVDFPGAGSGRPGYQISNDNRLLVNYPGALGGKTGFTDDARHTFIGAAQRGGRRLVAVLLRAEQPTWSQAGQLLDYGFALQPGTQPVGVLVDAAPAGAAAGTGTGAARPAGAARGRAIGDPAAAAGGGRRGRRHRTRRAGQRPAVEPAPKARRTQARTFTGWLCLR